MQMIPLPPSENELQQSFNDHLSVMLDNIWAVQRLYSITNMVATIMGKKGNALIASSSLKLASREHEQFLAFHLRQSRACATVSNHKYFIG
jgi:hypothetical protein